MKMRVDNLCSVTVFCAFYLAISAQTEENGLFPVVFNLASHAQITTNATCGTEGPEVFCKLVEHVRIFPAENRHCDVCDIRGNNRKQRHPVTNAIDGRNSWWQSPSITNGRQMNFVTIDLDLGEIYQVAYVIVKAANSPRPGNWILERSVDGVTYSPWQYFAISDRECREFYNVEPVVGTPKFYKDDQVICTSVYSRLDPLENGEIFVSLVNDRPGANEPSETLLEFTSARYIRLRLQKIRTLHADLMTFQRNINLRDLDPTVTRRYFYSIKDISVGGQCICYGHARFCRPHAGNNNLQCDCEHNTCGKNCEECCPGFNQKPWGRGVNGNGYGCEACNCHGKTNDCVYNATIDQLGLSLNAKGQYEGGGVCINCKANTGGVNCETCKEGYYRPAGIAPTDDNPCRPCRCSETMTSTSRCVPDDSSIQDGMNPGDCICKSGYGGERCDRCQFGYYGYPNCKPCPCNPAGIENPELCDRRCMCKRHVEGATCDRCQPGYFNLDRNNPFGCTKCFCFGVTSMCNSTDWGKTQVTEMNGWVLTTRMADGLTLLPRKFGGWLEAKTYILSGNNVEGKSTWPITGTDVHYWLAPMVFTGNRLSSYGGMMKFTIKYTLDSSIDQKYHLSEPDVIIEGGGMMITNGQKYLREGVANQVSVPLIESEWMKLVMINNQLSGVKLSKEEMMTVLQSMMRVMIRATYHTAQDTVFIRDVSLDVVSPTSRNPLTLSSVEKCHCPPGYAGLSCESCAPGWRRQNGDLMNGVCIECSCHGHSSHCDMATGHCLNCQHHTVGPNCDKCAPGYYGDPRRGSAEDCQPCACPMLNKENNFGDECIYSPTLENRFDYQCMHCEEGHIGKHCEICGPGYYGNPMMMGGKCRPCQCSGNIDYNVVGGCNNVTGACQQCEHNTEGSRCDRCKPGYYGTAVDGDCKACDCFTNGAYNSQCQPSGQCLCRPNYTGKRCDRCQPGYGDPRNGCTRCNCNSVGSVNMQCHDSTGQCRCKPGVSGIKCDKCADGYHHFNYNGCTNCNCDIFGTDRDRQCDPLTGQCYCLSNVQGRQCNACRDGYWGLKRGNGCEACDCNAVGSNDDFCDGESGQCRCRPGIGGRQCEKCVPGYYGYGYQGCKECEPCNKRGHICDPRTGKCVCPPYTTGRYCEKCEKKSWGYDPLTGCKPCNCSTVGSRSQRCDSQNGVCRCKNKFQGYSCDQCLFGYSNFPNCDECNCNVDGTDPDSCDTSSVCKCNLYGQCQCRDNVDGRQCDRCKKNTFGFDSNNPDGCTECFCFGRSQTCQQSPYSWTTISLPVQRVNVDSSSPNTVQRYHGYTIMNTGRSAVQIPEYAYNNVIYWSLPDAMLGDKTLSYNGKLNLILYYESKILNPIEFEDRAVTLPVVTMIGNGFKIHYMENISIESGHPQSFSVHLHQKKWHLSDSNNAVSRALLMVILQNIEAILVPATNGLAEYAELGPLGLQIAKPVSGTNVDVALGVELCTCPSRYSGDSCQDPGDGYYRVPMNGTLNKPETAIGEVRECLCHGHSDNCNPITGQCENCQHDTTGDRCDICLPGYHGNARRGSSRDCTPCACPGVERNNSFSTSCEIQGNKLLCTNCSEGYEGERCERCQVGYYGQPTVPGDNCKPCGCNPEGSLGPECDPTSGRCRCLSGIRGIKCDQCDPGYAVQNGKCTSCSTGCTGILLKDLSEVHSSLPAFNFTIRLPWNKLYKISNKTELLTEQLKKSSLISLPKYTEMKNNTRFLMEVAMRLINRVEFVEEKSLETAEMVDRTYRNATDFEKLINKVFEGVKDDAEKLESLMQKLIFDKIGQNVTAVLEEAKRILKEIKQRDFSNPSIKSQDENWLSEKLLKRVKGLNAMNFNGSKVQKEMEDVEKRLNDLQQRARDSSKIAKRVIDEESLVLASSLNNLEMKLNTARGGRDEIENHVKDGKFYINEARDYLDRLRENYIALERKESSLGSTNRFLDQTIFDLARVFTRTEDAVNRAWQHSLRLKEQASELDRIFSKARADAENPLRAAKVYQSIVDAIGDAEKAANNALQAARRAVEISNIFELKNDVRESKENSRRLQEKARITKDQGISNLDNGLSLVNSDLQDIMMKQQSNRDMLDMVKRDMNNLPTGLRYKVNDVAGKADDVSRKMGNIADTVNRTINKIDNLKMKVDDLQDKDLNAIIRHVQILTRNISDTGVQLKNLTMIVRDKSRETNRLNGDVSDKIGRLKEKIRLAREKANDMKLSLSGAGACSRSYRSVSQPSTANSIRFAFKVNKPSRDADMLLALVYMSPQEYMAVELKSRNVHFRWNVGKGEGLVIHDQIVKMGGEDEIEQDKWYQVSAKRIGRVGLLKVMSMARNAPETDERSDFSIIGSSILNFNATNSEIYLAGVPQGFELPVGISQNNLDGCIGDVYVDDQRVGVYNFKTTNGKECSACVEVPTSPSSTNIYHFDGTGYSKMNRGRRYSNRKISIVLSFKTYWENAILHFSGDPEKGDFMSIELVDGKVRLQYYMGGISLGTNTTINNYNTNKWVKVTVQRQRTMALLTVNGEQRFITPPPGNDGLDLKNSPMYFGGIPKSINMNKFMKVTPIETTNLYGCLRDISVGNISPDLQNLFIGEYVGMTAGCADTGVRVTGFYGDGFSMYNGQSLNDGNTDVSVSFVTRQPNALLLLSTDIPQLNYFSLSLVGGKVIAQFTVDSIGVSLESNTTFNDGVLHNIGVIKSNSRIVLLVNDQKHQEGELPDGATEIPISADGSLYLGGIPRGLTVSSNVPTTAKLEGCLSNIIINGGLMVLNKPKQYERADIGRCSYRISPAGGAYDTDFSSRNADPFLATEASQTTPEDGKAKYTTPLEKESKKPKVDSTIPTLTTSTTTTDYQTTSTSLPDTTTIISCATSRPFTFSDGASSFGNTEAGYALMKVKRRDISKSFNISFDFRTFYPDGLFGFLTNSDQSDYLAAQLKNGAVHLSYVLNIQKNIVSDIKYNDGKWHTIKITKERKQIQFVVDGREVKKSRIRNKLDINAPIYVGGLPENFVRKTDIVHKSIRGCVRNFIINDDLIKISDRKVISGVGQCYEKVERGAYFDGSSFGAYKKNLRVKNDFSIVFNIRTTEPYGVLASSSRNDGHSAIALEIINGQIQFTVKSGDMKYSVVTNLSTTFRYCDSEWHGVNARISSGAIYLSVDNDREAVVNAPDVQEFKTNSPLFIGGIAENFPIQAAAAISNGYKGCMRDVTINNEDIDWYDLLESRGIRRIACPR